MSGNIKDLFANKIERHIEEVIKVDQTDEEIVWDEIREYVVTNSICKHYQGILDRYWETPKKPHEGVGVWVSGFFGSGKSSFAKNLGLALENRSLKGEGAGSLFAKQTGDETVQVLLSNIGEHIPTQAVIFDVSTDRGIRSGNQTLTEIMYRLFLDRLGYAKDLDLAELEITLEGEGRLNLFKETFQTIYGKDWDREKGKVAFAISWASRVMHELEPETYSNADSWSQAAKNRADVTPNMLADRCKQLMDRKRPGKSLAFVIDEVGQFVARDIQKMLDLQAVVQSLGRVGRGKMWIVVTSQESLNEIIGGIVQRSPVSASFPKPPRPKKPSGSFFHPTGGSSPNARALRLISSCRSYPPRLLWNYTRCFPTISISSSRSYRAYVPRVGPHGMSGAPIEPSSSWPSSFSFTPKSLLRKSRWAPWSAWTRFTTWLPETLPAKSGARLRTSKTRSPTLWPSQSPSPSACCSS